MIPSPRGASRPLLSVEGLRVTFPIVRGRFLRKVVGALAAVDGVSLQLARGETLGIVGESGCGKSTLALALMRLVPSSGGRIDFDGLDWLAQEGEALRLLRRRVQMVFQDAAGSLSPRRSVGDSIAEPLVALSAMSPLERATRVDELLTQCGLSPELGARLPGELSGGQRQRVAIARALALDPEVVIADEPTSALDAVTRARVLELFQSIVSSATRSLLFVSHDLPAVRRIANRVAVMYLGKFVEEGDVAAVLDSPAHPYTAALVSAVPVADPTMERTRSRIVLEGEVPSAVSPPTGCRFHPRCPLYARLGEAERGRCRSEEPLLRAVGDSQAAACHWTAGPGPSAR